VGRSGLVSTEVELAVARLEAGLTSFNARLRPGLAGSFIRSSFGLDSSADEILGSAVSIEYKCLS